MFATPGPLDFVAVATATLQFWEREHVFSRLVAKNRGARRFSFLDGPITANNPMGVHHAWGRTFKDAVQRYHAMLRLRAAVPERLRLPGAVGGGRGREDARLQRRSPTSRRSASTTSRAPAANGSMHFAAGPDRAVEAARPVDGLGQLLLHVCRRQHRAIWLFLQKLPRAGLALRGTRADAVVHALRHLPLAARDARILRRDSTTSRCTSRLPLGRPRPPRCSCGRRRRGRCPRTWRRPSTPTSTTKSSSGDGHGLLMSPRGLAGRSRRSAGRGAPSRAPSSSGCEFEAPFHDLPVAAGIEHRVIPWEEIDAEEGTGIVHIAPGCGPEDYELSQGSAST